MTGQLQISDSAQLRVSSAAARPSRNRFQSVFAPQCQAPWDRRLVDHPNEYLKHAGALHGCKHDGVTRGDLAGFDRDRLAVEVDHRRGPLREQDHRRGPLWKQLLQRGGTALHDRDRPRIDAERC